MYNKFKYYYPPRAKTNFAPDKLDHFDQLGKYVVQPKLNGSCTLVFTDGNEVHVYNRHKDKLGKNSSSKYFKIEDGEILSLHRGKGWMVLVGEYMNKACKDENNKLWNHKLCIFDILVYGGQYLKGKNIMERLDILGKIYPESNPDYPDKSYLSAQSENVYVVYHQTTGFKEMFDKITKWDMYEGLVLKSLRPKLLLGLSATSDIHSQIKCRKPTKNYSY